MTEDLIKIHLDSSTYVTKVNGKLVVVRERRERLRDLCLDLLREAFGKYSRRKMKSCSKKQEGKKVQAQNPTATPVQNVPTPELYNPNTSLIGPTPVQSIMGPMGPQPGVYRFGNRQLALLPLNPQGGPAIAPQTGYLYTSSPWMFPQASNINAFNFPPNGVDPRQFIINSAPPGESAGQPSVTVTKHVCAECGKLRSRKYQHENPLKSGETPFPAFCKKCQKDVTSTEESDSSIKEIKKHQKWSKGSGKKNKVKDDIESSHEFIDSYKLREVSKPKKGSRNQRLDEDINQEEKGAKSSRRHRHIYPSDDEEYITNREETSPMPEKAHVRHTRSTSSSQDIERDRHIHHPCANQQAQSSSRESVPIAAAETFHHSRKVPSQSTYDTYETDRVSVQSRSNEDSASPEPTQYAGHNFEDNIISTSRTRSEEASRRRRLERSIDRQGFHQEATGLPPGVHPLEEDEVVVVTERYVIRPRRLPHLQEDNLESRGQNSMDKTTVRAEKSYPRFVAEAEASEYYRKDWSIAGDHDEADHESVLLRDLEGLIAPINSHNSDTSSSTRYRARSDDHYLPRAPSPLNSPRQEKGLRAQTGPFHHNVSYSPREIESLPSPVDKNHRIAREQEVATRGRGSNNYRPPYVREATDRGTERALMPSHKHSHDKMFYPDTNDSEITEEIERVERRVTFQDPDIYEDYGILSGKLGSARVLRQEGKRRK